MPTTKYVPDYINRYYEIDNDTEEYYFHCVLNGQASFYQYFVRAFLYR